MLSQQQIKQQVAQQAVKLVQDNMIVGLGSGTTAHWFILALAERVKGGLHIQGVPTSKQTQKLAGTHGIPMKELNEVTHIDITIDGADEVDGQLQLIKGGGGALLQEKMVAFASQQLVILADHSKLVKQLGKFPLPVEVIPYGWKLVQRTIEKNHAVVTALRMRDNKTFVTDHGHYILDCNFQHIANAPELHNELNNIPGVVENGLFVNLAKKVIAGHPDGHIDILTT
jgi:ribose 5-phosphate isomerase A